MVAVAYRRCSFTGGSNCKALTGNVLVFWVGGRLRKVVAPGASTVFQRHSMFVIFLKKTCNSTGARSVFKKVSLVHCKVYTS